MADLLVTGYSLLLAARDPASAQNPPSMNFGAFMFTVVEQRLSPLRSPG